MVGGNYTKRCWSVEVSARNEPAYRVQEGTKERQSDISSGIIEHGPGAVELGGRNCGLQPSTRTVVSTPPTFCPMGSAVLRRYWPMEYDRFRKRAFWRAVISSIGGRRPK